MQRKQSKTAAFLARRRRQRRWTRMVSVLACVVVFVTTYALVLPALTLETTAGCGLEEHTHTDECYTRELICGREETEGHIHTDECSATIKTLVCGLDAVEAHTHTDECRGTQDVLVCQLAESEGHQHSEECYDEEGSLTCGQEESEGHTHGDACYETQEVFVCGKEETEGHTHTDECYQLEQRVCTVEETGHVHTDECYKLVLTCEKVEHSHTEECYTLSYPAKTFRKILPVNGISVTVDAPEGAFPKGTEMTVSQAPQEAVEAAAAAVGADASEVKAVDITFTYEGEEIQPQVPISVKLTSSLVKQADDPVVVHVDDNANATVIENTDVATSSVTFETDSFSVYAIVGTDKDGNDIEDPRYIYEFYVGTDLVETQIITGGTLLPQPEIPDVPENSAYNAFVGWYIGGALNSTTGVYEGGTPVTFGTLEKSVHDAALETFQETAEYEQGKDNYPTNLIRVHARFADMVTVTFMMTGENDNGVRVEEIVTTKSAPRYSAVDINDVTAMPPSSDLGFVGWSYESEDADRIGSVINTDTITVTANNTIIYAAFEQGRTLTFVNGEGATPTTSQFVVYLAKTVEPANKPTRAGYTFDGWYTAETGGEKFVFGSTLTEDTTIYARWTANEVGFNVVFWYENADNEEYSYAGYASATATAGSSVSSSTYQNLTFEDGTRDDTHFTYNSAKAETQTVAGDGSTVLNVYFTRKTYKLTFATDSKTYDSTDDVITYGTITAKYQASIGNQWPVPGETMTGSTVAVPSNLTRWSVTKVDATSATTQATKLDTMTAEYCSDAGIEFHARIATDTKEFTINYMMESLDGTGIEYNGTRYEKDDRYSQTLVYPDSQTTWNAKEIDGFTAVTKEVSLDAGDVFTLYYSRNRNDITFNDNHGNFTATISGVMFEKNLSELTYNGTSLSEIVPTYYDAAQAQYYEFKGWYTTQEGVEGTEAATVLSGTMPNAPLTFYAKWEAKTVTVTYNPAGGRFWDNSTDSREREIPYNSTTDEYNLAGTYEGHTFQGWYYTDAQGNESPWNFGDAVTIDLTLTAKWRADTAVSIKYQVWDSEEKDWVEKELDLGAYLDGANVVLAMCEDEDFAGWRLNDPDNGAFYSPGDYLKISEDMFGENYTITLYAVYDVPNTTTLTFNANGGTFGTNDDGTSQTKIIMENLQNNTGIDLDGIAKPTKAGCIFLGWATSTTATKAEFETDGTEKQDIAVDVAAENQQNILYAVWEEVYVNLTIKKVDTADSTTTLAGAVFTLKNADGKYYSYDADTYETSWVDEASAQKLTTATGGLVNVPHVLAGSYTLTEVKAPDGYNLLEKAITVTITLEKKVTVAYGDGSSDKVSFDEVDQNIIVTNSAGLALPNTGGSGTEFIVITGFTLMCIAGSLLYIDQAKQRKRRGGRTC